MQDPYARVLLTVIALALVAIAVQLGANPVATAHAAGECSVELRGPIELRGPVDVRGTMRLEGIGSTVKVEIEQAYGEAGSSSGNPLYVKPLN